MAACCQDQKVKVRRHNLAIRTLDEILLLDLIDLHLLQVDLTHTIFYEIGIRSEDIGQLVIPLAHRLV